LRIKESVQPRKKFLAVSVASREQNERDDARWHPQGYITAHRERFLLKEKRGEGKEKNAGINLTGLQRIMGLEKKERGREYRGSAPNFARHER